MIKLIRYKLVRKEWRDTVKLHGIMDDEVMEEHRKMKKCERCLMELEMIAYDYDSNLSKRLRLEERMVFVESNIDYLVEELMKLGKEDLESP